MKLLLKEMSPNHNKVQKEGTVEDRWQSNLTMTPSIIIEDEQLDTIHNSLLFPIIYEQFDNFSIDTAE